MARRPDLFQLCPGKKTFSPVSPDSLEIHRGRWKTGGLQHHVGVGGARRRRGDESGTRCFILFWYRKDMAFTVFEEHNQTWAVDEGLVSVLACGDLSLLSGRYVCRGASLAAFLTTFTHSVCASFNASTALTCCGDNEFVKPGIELYMYHCRENRNYSLMVHEKK